MEKEKIIVAAAVTNCPDGVRILGDDLCGFFIEKKYLGEHSVSVGDEITVILFDNIVAGAFIKNQMIFMKTFEDIMQDKEDENPDALFDELPALLRHRFCMMLHQVPEHLRESEKKSVLSGYAMFMFKNRAGACCNELRGLDQKPYIFARQIAAALRDDDKEMDISNPTKDDLKKSKLMRVPAYWQQMQNKLTPMILEQNEQLLQNYIAGLG